MAPGVLHAAELKRRNQHEVELAPGMGCRCSPRATRAPARGDRRSRRGCARPWRRRSRDETCGACARRAAPSRRKTFRRRTRRDTSAAAVSRRTWSLRRQRRSVYLRPVGNGLPAVGDGQGHVRGPSDPAGRSRGTPGRARAGTNNVQKVIVAVESFVAGGELELDPVRTGSRHPGGHDDVTIDDRGAASDRRPARRAAGRRAARNRRPAPRGRPTPGARPPDPRTGPVDRRESCARSASQVPDRGYPFPGKASRRHGLAQPAVRTGWSRVTTAQP